MGALVPAAVMSIAAANLFTRDICEDFVKPNAAPEEETEVSELVSLRSCPTSPWRWPSPSP